MSDCVAHTEYSFSKADGSCPLESTPIFKRLPDSLGGSAWENGTDTDTSQRRSHDEEKRAGRVWNQCPKKSISVAEDHLLTTASDDTITSQECECKKHRRSEEEAF